MKHYDVAIVGTGPSAASVFNSVTSENPSINICFLEAGDKFESYAGNLGVKASERFRLSPSIYTGPGGTSELWHHVLAPLDAIDFEKRLEIGNPGWGITLDDLKPHYEKVLRLLGVLDKKIFWDYDLTKEISGLGLSQFLEDFEPKLFIQLKKRWKAIQYLRSQKANIHYQHFVKDFKIFSDRVELSSVDFYGEPNPIVCASKVILCAGGLHTPQIVFNSDVNENVRNNVGQNLLDHPMGVGMQLRRDRRYNFEILTSKKTQFYNKKLAFRLKDSVQREEALPNSSYYFKPAFKEGYSEFTEDLKNKILTYRDYLKRGRIPIKMTTELVRDWNLVAQIIQYKTGLLSATDLFDIFCVTEQISRRSHISFEKNSEGYYVGQCNWDVDAMDQKYNEKILKKIEQWIDSQDSKSGTTVRSESVRWTQRAASAAHHIGTVRMASDDASGCVDLNGAIFGSQDKIFVGDASVMPSAGCANVTLTSMAIANRVGEYVCETL